MKPSEILLEARELVAAGDCKGCAAMTQTGQAVAWDEDAAVSWCTVGALAKAGQRDSIDKQRAAGAFVRGLTAGDIARAHDSSTHLENVVRLEKAALLAISEGQ